VRTNDAVPRQVRETAQTLVEIVAGVMQTDAASLWSYDEHEARLVARFPQHRMPEVKVFADMPEVGASITAEETELYIRSESTGPVREWMEQAGVSVSLRVPVGSPEVHNHFLGLSWESEDHPPVDALLPTARRLAEHIALALTRLAAQRRRIESALELADNVAQALVVAKGSLHLGRHDDAEQAIDRALDETARIMGRLMREDDSGDLSRMYPSDVLGTADQRRADARD
jgi:hypothetical protein